MRAEYLKNAVFAVLGALAFYIGVSLLANIEASYGAAESVTGRITYDESQMGDLHYYVGASGECRSAFRGYPHRDMRLKSVLKNYECHKILENGGGLRFYCKGLGKIYYIKRVICSRFEEGT